MQAQALVVVMLAASVSAQAAEAQKPAPDAWVGTWAVVGGNRPAAVIVKDGEGYQLRMPAYETQRFKEVVPGALECRHLGVIRRGTMTFAGVPGEVVVLRAEFCYEIFYLLYVGPPPAK
jgi:hypothetical protein